MLRRKHDNQPVWLKLYTDTREMALAAPSDSLGDAVKGLFRLLEEPDYRGEDLSLAAKLLFLQLRRGTDESIREYQRAVDCGKRGAAMRWDRTADEDSVPQDGTETSVWDGVAPGYFPVWEGMMPELRQAHERLNAFQRQLDAAASEAVAGSDSQ